MNRTSTSHGYLASPQLQWAQFFIAFSSPGCTHATGSRGDISDQYTHFSSTYTALCTVKETVECDESQVDLTRQCDKSPVAMSTVFFIAFSSPEYTHAAGSR